LIGRYAALDVINEKTGEIYVEAGQEITQAVLDLFDENDIDVLPTLAIDHANVGPYIRNTLAADKNSNREEALLDVYRVMRPGEPPTLEQAETLFNGLLFYIERYDLSPVGRVKMNMRLGFEAVPDSQRTLRREDILSVVKVLHGLKDGRGEIDDIDHLGNRRVRSSETPEGPNIGLINSLATYARVNQYGFIESPYRKVANSRVSDEVIYLSAMEEGRYTVAQANAEIDARGKFVSELVQCRKGGEYILARPETIDFVDVSPKQIVSVAAALIPFLENDDANRALMGSNMQRQAVPLIQAEAPLVGTGMDEAVARDSGVAIAPRRTGHVDQVDAMRIVVRATDDVGPNRPAVDIYNLLKFQRSNQSTCITQKPLVKVGDQVKRGDIVADGPSTRDGELALGRNVLVAFMPWNGYNFEDSILLSERIVRDDVFTSIHIEEFEVMARDTKLGQEEISRDIPNVGEEALKNLDEAGIVYIGAEVKPGDILVGKITPKGESPMTPEEKLLRAIFGEKASDVR